MQLLNKLLFGLFLILFTSLALAQPVNVNTATAEELTALDGIGPVKAEAIIQYREANGPFESLEQLQEVKGIGPKTIDNNRERIIFAPPEPDPGTGTTDESQEGDASEQPEPSQTE